MVVEPVVVVMVEPSDVTTPVKAEVVMALDEPVMLPMPAPDPEAEPVLLAPDRLGQEVPLKATESHQHVAHDPCHVSKHLLWQ